MASPRGPFPCASVCAASTCFTRGWPVSEARMSVVEMVIAGASALRAYARARGGSSDASHAGGTRSTGGS